MTGIVTAVRSAINTKLRADVDVVAAFSPQPVKLYPLAPPTDPEFPYVRYRVEAIGDDTECAAAAEVTATLDVFARGDTYAESVAQAEAIADAIRKSLTGPMSLTDHQVDDWTFDFDRPLGDPDVLTEHRVVQLTFLTSATA